MKLIVDDLKIMSPYGQLRIEVDYGQKCFHIWFIPFDSEIEVDGNHIRIKDNFGETNS